jgi:hypothetical protein
MKLHQYFEFGPASQDPFSFCQIQLALDTVCGDDDGGFGGSGGGGIGGSGGGGGPHDLAVSLGLHFISP